MAINLFWKNRMLKQPIYQWWPLLTVLPLIYSMTAEEYRRDSFCSWGSKQPCYLWSLEGFYRIIHCKKTTSHLAHKSANMPLAQTHSAWTLSTATCCGKRNSVAVEVSMENESGPEEYSPFREQDVTWSFYSVYDGKWGARHYYWVDGGGGGGGPTGL